MFLSLGNRVNQVTALAAVVGLLALFGPSWLLLKANRLVAGDVFGAFALPGPYAYALLAAWLLLLLLSFVRLPGRAWGLALFSALALTAGLLLVGEGSSTLLTDSPDPERRACRSRAGCG